MFTTSRINLWGIRIITWLVNVGLLPLQSAAGLIERAEGPMDPEITPEQMLQEVIDGKGSVLPPLFALAKGKRNNEPASAASMILSAPVGGMGGSTDETL